MRGNHVVTGWKEDGMQNDEPTLPHHIGFAPDDTTDLSAFAEAPT